MRRSTAVVLILFALALLVFFYLQKNPLPKANATLEPTFTPVESLLHVDGGSVTGVRIQSADGTMEVVKNGSDWQLKQPTVEPANKATVDAVVQQLTSLIILDKLSVQPSLDQIGLAKPVYTIVISQQSGPDVTLYLGNENAVKSGYYARLDNGNAVVVPNSPLTALIGMVKDPPRVPTPTPSPTPDATETPAPAGATPTP